VSNAVRIGILGDFNPDFRSHHATTDALQHAARKIGLILESEWIPTSTLTADGAEKILESFDGLWASPGSPYKSFDGMLKGIEFARHRDWPFLGTCGGFQHMVIEFARNVLGIKDAEHAETNPYASRLVINPLSCSLVGKALNIRITDLSSKTYALLQQTVIVENYYCNFGLNPEYQEEIHQNGFRVVASDEQEEARILELEKHDFFIGTLFVPQMRSTPDTPHPIVTGFLKAIINTYNQ